MFLMTSKNSSKSISPACVTSSRRVARSVRRWRRGRRRSRIEGRTPLHAVPVDVEGVEEGREDAPEADRVVASGRVLREAGIHHEILEYNPKTVRDIRAAGELAHYGDATRSEVLRHLRVSEFDSAVIAIPEAEATRRTVSVLRRLHPNVYLIARTRFVTEVEQLQTLGANVVVPEEFETSLRRFAELLTHYHLPPHIIAVQMDLVRRRSYGLLRSENNSGSLDRELQPLLMKRLVEAVPIAPDHKTLGKTLGALGFGDGERCSVISVIRGSGPLPAPYDTTVIEANDLIVLYGDHAALDAAKAAGGTSSRRE